MKPALALLAPTSLTYFGVVINVGVVLDGFGQTLFSQIFVILAHRDRGFAFHLLFALLRNKSRQTYSRLFDMIHGICFMKWTREN